MSKNSNISKAKLFTLFFIIFVFAAAIAGMSYYIMKNEQKQEIKKTKIDKNLIENKKTLVDKSNEFSKNKLNEYFDIKSKETLYEENNKDLKENIDHEEEKKAEEKKLKKINKISSKKTKYDKYKYNKKDKPKLAIIIDDVSTKKQKKKILNIGYKVTMSFLPPTKRHKNSAKIALDLPFYMIHFPMQASKSFKGAEDFTLNIDDSYEIIEKRVQQLRNWYPKAKFTNNHTGSVFTKTPHAVDKLFRALKKYNFIFVDSRTTAKSVVKEYSKKYDMPYIVRNTFIDNKRDFKYIQKQLKKAIKIAKKSGYAIAIGHPHNITIEVLRKSKHLLKGIELIYVNELPYL